MAKTLGGGDKEPINTHGGFRWSLPPEQKRIRKNFRLPPDIIKILDAQSNQTEFIISAIREKVERDSK
jgi:hypothetical protein